MESFLRGVTLNECFFILGLHSQQLYKPHWHTSMMMPTHNSWINQFSKPSLVQSAVSATPNYSQAPQQQLSQQSPQSSYPPTPPKDDMRASSENDSAFTPTSGSSFPYPDYQTSSQHNAAVFNKQNSSSNSQNGGNSPSANTKSKSRARTGTGKQEIMI